MKNMIDKDFYSVCEKDINEILEQFLPLLPENIEDWQLNRGYYKDDEKTMISKPLIDDYNDVVGQCINIILLNEGESYTLEYKNVDEISLALEKSYYKGKDQIIEKKEVILSDSTITRDFTIYINDKLLSYDIGYNLSYKGHYDDYLDSPSLNEVIKTMYPNVKIRKRN